MQMFRAEIHIPVLAYAHLARLGGARVLTRAVLTAYQGLVIRLGWLRMRDSTLAA
jgi:hypothetical protein